jgi:CheY-like chemotaxis protein
MKKHVLLIDDDNDEVDILCSALNRASIDHKCTWVQSVAHALRVMEHLKPDVIFIDFNMPVINGVDGIAMIRQMNYAMNIPIVLYSNTISKENREIAMRLGAKACIQKPSTVELLASELISFFHEDYGNSKKQNTNMKNTDQPIMELALSEPFKKKAADNGFTNLQQLLELPVTRLFEMSWISHDMIDELAKIVKQKKESSHA